MTANYSGLSSKQRARKRTLTMLREMLGDKMFADFVTAALVENGSTFSVDELPALAEIWLVRRMAALKADEEDAQRSPQKPVQCMNAEHGLR